MSKEQQVELGIDYVIVWGEGNPLYIRADSDRAKALFEQWGVRPEVAGILPPPDAMDFISSMPRHWLVGMEIAWDKNKEYLVQEIPLPRDRLVVH